MDATVDLQWDEPWNGVGTDIDTYLLNAGGGLIKESIEETSTSARCRWRYSLDQRELHDEDGAARRQPLRGHRLSGGQVRADRERQRRGSDRVPEIVGRRGHRGSDNIRAQRLEQRYLGRRGVLRRSSKPEPYSSRGPVVHDFNPVEGTTPSERLSPGKPSPSQIWWPPIAARRPSSLKSSWAPGVSAVPQPQLPMRPPLRR